jgi:hypothetical protein
MTQDCAHVWMIDPPNGPTSPGTCRLCGDTRTDFLNAPFSHGAWGQTAKAKRRSREENRAFNKSMVEQSGDLQAAIGEAR